MDDPFDLHGKTALVTGAGRGIGREIARTLARAGADIVVAEFDPATGEEAAAELRALGRRARFAPVDVADPDSVRAMAEAAWAEPRPIDILVNNAGVAGGTTLPGSSTSLIGGVVHGAQWRRSTR